MLTENFGVYKLKRYLVFFLDKFRTVFVVKSGICTGHRENTFYSDVMYTKFFCFRVSAAPLKLRESCTVDGLTTVV